MKSATSTAVGAEGVKRIGRAPRLVKIGHAGLGAPRAPQRTRELSVAVAYSERCLELHQTDRYGEEQSSDTRVTCSRQTMSHWKF